MNFLTGITNLTSWMGNVIMPTLAALFFALGVLRYAHGQAHTYAPWAGFLCLMVSGVLRGIGCGISAPPHCAWCYPACCGWRNGSSRKGLAELAE